MTKQTPKSCSCRACRRGKRSRAGKIMMHNHEKSFRQLNKLKLSKYTEDTEFSIAPTGNYYD